MERTHAKWPVQIEPNPCEMTRARWSSRDDSPHRFGMQRLPVGRITGSPDAGARCPFRVAGYAHGLLVRSDFRWVLYEVRAEERLQSGRTPGGVRIRSYWQDADQRFDYAIALKRCCQIQLIGLNRSGREKRAGPGLPVWHRLDAAAGHRLLPRGASIRRLGRGACRRCIGRRCRATPVRTPGRSRARRRGHCRHAHAVRRCCRQGRERQGQEKNENCESPDHDRISGEVDLALYVSSYLHIREKTIEFETLALRCPQYLPGRATILCSLPGLYQADSDPRFFPLLRWRLTSFITSFTERFVSTVGVSSGDTGGSSGTTAYRRPSFLRMMTLPVDSASSSKVDRCCLASE